MLKSVSKFKQIEGFLAKIVEVVEVVHLLYDECYLKGGLATLSCCRLDMQRHIGFSGGLPLM